jgi:hypothetical protein
MTLDEIFIVNDDLIITESNDTFIIVDNFYKNFDLVENFLNNETKKLPDKFNYESGVSSTRFIYQDNLILVKNKISELVMRFFNMKTLFVKETIIKFFKVNDLGIKNDFQLRVHIDNYITALVHLDNTENGGTAIFEKNYECKDVFKSRHALYKIDNKSIVKILEAKKNRLVIFKSEVPHCVYINNYEKQYERNRITQLFFTDPIFKGMI